MAPLEEQKDTTDTGHERIKSIHSESPFWLMRAASYMVAAAKLIVSEARK